jgi:hypothetical protein
MSILPTIARAATPVVRTAFYLGYPVLSGRYYRYMYFGPWLRVLAARVAMLSCLPIFAAGGDRLEDRRFDWLIQGRVAGASRSPPAPD